MIHQNKHIRIEEQLIHSSFIAEIEYKKSIGIRVEASIDGREFVDIDSAELDNLTEFYEFTNNNEYKFKARRFSHLFVRYTTELE